MEMGVCLTPLGGRPRQHRGVASTAEDGFNARGRSPNTPTMGSGSTEGEGLLPWSCTNDGSGRRARPLLFAHPSTPLAEEVDRLEAVSRPGSVRKRAQGLQGER